MCRLQGRTIERCLTFWQSAVCLSARSVKHKILLTRKKFPYVHAAPDLKLVGWFNRKELWEFAPVFPIMFWAGETLDLIEIVNFHLILHWKKTNP